MTTETVNDFLVCAQGGDIVTIMPVPQRLGRDIALRLAAWLAVVADPAGDDFAAVLEAVRST